MSPARRATSRAVRAETAATVSIALDAEQTAVRRDAWFDALWLACGGAADTVHRIGALRPEDVAA